MITHNFQARPTQYEVLSNVLNGNWKYGAFVAGIGSGKTATGSHFALDRISNNPETVGFIGANTYKQLDQSTLKSFFTFLKGYGIDYVYNTNPERKYGYKSKFKDHRGIISFPKQPNQETGCQIITRSLDNYEDIRGIEIGWFWIDESRDTKKEAWDVLKGRLRCKLSKMLCGFITTTPNGYDWLYIEFEEKPNTPGEKKLNPGHHYVTCSTRENQKNLPENFIDDLESSYDELTAEQEIGGKFINTRTGRVYYSFNRDHNIKEYTYQPELPIKLCVDFNVDPMKWALIQTVGNEDIIFDEFAKNNTNTESMAREVREKYPNASFMLYGDYSGTFRDTRSRTTDIEIIKTILNISEDRIKIKPNPPVNSRITSMNGRFCNVKGDRRLFVTKNCIHTIRDFENVVYDKNGKIEKDNNDQIKKQLTHISDAIGYYTEYEYSLKGRPVFRQRQ